MKPVSFIRTIASILAACCLALLASCAHAPMEARPGLAYTAVASWYGPGFNGKRTASGEVFDMDRPSAAHRTFPFGTKLRVTNPKTGKSVDVTVNDRGPFVAGRELDLSKAAAFEIGALSTCAVHIEVLGRDTSYVKTVKLAPTPGRGAFRVQIGSFTDASNAERLKMGLEISHDNVRISRATVGGRLFNRVQLGSFKDKDDAMELARSLADEGYDTLLVRDRN